MDKIYQVKYLSLLCTHKASSNVIFTCLGGEYCSLIGLSSSEESFKAQTLTISHEGKNTLTSYDRSNNDSSNSYVNANTISPFICYKFYEQINWRNYCSIWNQCLCCMVE